MIIRDYLLAVADVWFGIRYSLAVLCICAEMVSKAQHEK
jgi:hypothetical protein